MHACCRDVSNNLLQFVRTIDLPSELPNLRYLYAEYVHSLFRVCMLLLYTVDPVCMVNWLLGSYKTMS